MNVNDVLSRLDKVKQTKNNEWIACCPAHNDHKPSLAIKLNEDGKILIKCWSGCSVEEITNAIGINLSDLFPNKNDNYNRQNRTYFSPATILKTIRHEMTVLEIASADIVNNNIDIDSHNRIVLARDRVKEALEYCKL